MAPVLFAVDIPTNHLEKSTHLMILSLTFQCVQFASTMRPYTMKRRERTVTHARSITRMSEPEDIPTHSYWVQHGGRWTFSDDTVREWLIERLNGRVLNACCGQTRLGYDGTTIRNDANPEIDADYNVKLRDLPNENPGQFDTVIFDPPWSDYQAVEKYQGRHVHRPRIAARAITDMLRDGGKVISFGYTTTAMPDKLGYQTTEIAVFRITGWNNDFFGVVDRRTDSSITNW